MHQVGIPARIRDGRGFQRWFLVKPLAGIRAQVSLHQFAAARKLLAEWDAADRALAAAVRCPDCDLSRVQFPQFSQHFIDPSIGVFLATLGFVPKEFYCEDCYYSWPAMVKGRPPMDILGWPLRRRKMP